MSDRTISRREFIGSAAAAALLIPAASRAGETPAKEAPPKAKRTAADQVELGSTGLRLSRLGIGTGSQGGNIQRALGREEFNRLVRHAWDRGLTYIDTADSYRIHDWVREAVKGLPREKLFIQTKIGGNPENPLAEIERIRKELGTDYIDSLLVHCAFTRDWQEERKRLIDALSEAKERKLIRARGVSCHSLPALERSIELPWLDVQLVRVNPQGAHMDTPREHWEVPSDASHVPAVLKALKSMREKGRGIIGMKIIGNGDFTKAEDREKSIRFAMGCGLLHAIVVGTKSPAEIDEAIERIDRALAETA